MKLFLLIFKEKGHRENSYYLEKEREYNRIEKFGLAGIKSLQSFQNDKVIKTETRI